jgi:hypothetical protein
MRIKPFKKCGFIEKQEENMVDKGFEEFGKSVGKSFGDVVAERFSNPLVTSFVIAWSLWNYKFFVILFSNASIKETFRLITEIRFPDALAWFLNGFFWPLVFTAVYIFLLPYPSRVVYRFWKTSQKRTNDIKQQIENQALLTLEESRELRARERALQDKLSAAINENSKLNDDLRALDERALNAEAQFDEANKLLSNCATTLTAADHALEFASSKLGQPLSNELLAETRKQIEELKAGPKLPEAAATMPDMATTEDRNPDSDGPDNVVANPAPSGVAFPLRVGDVVRNMRETNKPVNAELEPNELSQKELAMLVSIARSGPLGRTQIVDTAPDKIESAYILDGLVDRKFVQRTGSTRSMFRYEASHEGRGYLVKRGLTKS